MRDESCDHNTGFTPRPPVLPEPVLPSVAVAVVAGAVPRLRLGPVAGVASAAENIVRLQCQVSGTQ